MPDSRAPGDLPLYIAHHHAPPHLFVPGASYFVTARTVNREPVMQEASRRGEMLDALRFAAEQRHWSLVAWVVLNNHYHCILQAPDDSARSLSSLIEAAHKYTSRRWNALDRTVGRKVWYQYRDTCLTHEASFLARLNYIHFNPVKHKLVPRPELYEFSSYREWRDRDAGWLEGLELEYPWDRLDLE